MINRPTIYSLRSAGNPSRAFGPAYPTLDQAMRNLPRARRFALDATVYVVTTRQGAVTMAPLGHNPSK